MRPSRLQFGALSPTRVAASLGFATLATLLAEYVALVSPSGVVIGLLTTGLTAGKLTNLVWQPTFGRLPDRDGRAAFVFVGGGCYGLVALAASFAPAVGEALALPARCPVFGPLSAAFLTLLACNGLLGVADALRVPASMGLFADVGTDDGGIASSVGVRGPVWRAGPVAAPMRGGLLTTRVGMGSVFVAGGLAALAGVATVLGVLTDDHGPRALVEW